MPHLSTVGISGLLAGEDVNISIVSQSQHQRVPLHNRGD